MLPDGSVREIPASASLFDVAWNTPAGSDSLAVDAAQGPLMVSRRDGGSRPLGGPDEWVQSWSEDGKWLLLSVPEELGRAIEVMNVATGERRRVTTGGGSNVGAEFSPAGDTVFFRRNVPVNRVAAADLTKLLTAKP